MSASTFIHPWSEVPVWTHFRSVSRDSDGSGDVLSLHRGLGVIKKGSVEGNHNRTPEDLTRYQEVWLGDIVVNRMKAWQGSAGIAPQRGLISAHYLVFEPLTDRFDSRFLEWLLGSPLMTERYQRASIGIRTSQWELSRGAFAELRIPAPPQDVQRRIADMLDAETARIDTLIAKNERVLELLDLRDKSVIDRMVNPCESVDSHGWASPSEWPRVPIRSLTRTLFVDGDWIESPYITDDGVRLIQTGNIGIGRYKEQGFRYISEATFHQLRCTEVRPGDVLICRLADPVGRACVAPDLGVKMITSVDVAIVRTKPDVDADFVALILSTERWLQRLSAMSQGGTRDRVARLKLGELRVPLPDSATQRRVVERWMTVRRRSDELRSRVERQQELLRLRRQALITAAVTGRIEV